MLDVTPIGGTFGVTCTGLNSLAEATDAAVDEVKAQLQARLLVVLRGIDTGTPMDLRDFAKRFGPLNTYFRAADRNCEEAPEVLILSNVEDLGALSGSAEIQWHTNLGYQDRVAVYAFLNGIQTPPPELGGSTIFSNLQAAYAALDDDVKRQIEDLQVFRSQKGFHTQPGGGDDFDAGERIPGVVSPLVRLDPTTGEKTLYDIGDRWWVGIEGMTQEESDALRQRLFEHATQPRFVYEHRWVPGDLIIWDNLCTMHRRVKYRADTTRVARVLDVIEVEPSGVPRETVAAAASRS